MYMTREQRTAIARIISDMIKADNIIEESEIKDMKKLMSEYAITHQEMSDARKNPQLGAPEAQSQDEKTIDPNTPPFGS